MYAYKRTYKDKNMSDKSLKEAWGESPEKHPDMIALMGTVFVIENFIRVTQESILQNFAETYIDDPLDAEEIDIVRNTVDTVYRSIEGDLFKIWARSYGSHYTPSEDKELTKFYNSEVGKKSLDIHLQIARGHQDIMEVYGEKVIGPAVTRALS